jgi:hypothetical protein
MGMTNTKLKKSTSFHPHADGHMEVVNRIAVHLLKEFNRRNHKTWDESLPYIQRCYNQAMHSSNSKSPFEMCLDILPRTPFEISFAQTIGEKLMEHNDNQDKAIRFIKRIPQIHKQMEE